MSLKRNGLWIIFAVFAMSVMLVHDGEPLFFSQGPYGAGKSITWLIFLCFLAYSIYCSTQENIFRTIKTIFPLHWARQIGLDLYIGLLISGFIIYLNEGSLLIVALWVLPIFLFANLATLLYFAMNYDSIVSMFL